MKKLFRGLMACMVLIICAAFFATCRKEYSNEGGPKKSTAIYTLLGAGGNCTGNVLSGNYYMGKVLTSASSIQLQAEVTTIGTYSISTNSTDGFSFSASGSFVATGTQTVTLTAKGTPAAIGNFMFTATAVTGCSFSVTVSTAPVILAGFTTDCQRIQVNGRYTPNTKLTLSQNVVVQAAVTKTGAYSISTDTLDGIYFSAAGTFTSTGNKSITLNGFGTPDFARNLSFTLQSGNSTCMFAVTVTDADPLAVYVLESGSGNPPPCLCTVSGDYTVNTTLNASHTARISVYVTALGNFTVSTATVNGVLFSYSGVFTVLGSQKVILQGSGTPVAKGVSSFVPEIVGPHPLGGQACGFGVTVQ